MRDDGLLPMAWRARPDMSCEHVSAAWRAFTGYTLEEARGDGWTRCVHPDDLLPWIEACVRAFDERRPFRIEYRLRRRDGQYRWVLDRAAPRYSSEGAFLGYAGSCVELRRRSRHERGTSLAALRALSS